jgi:serine/threonine-protein kinase
VENVAPASIGKYRILSVIGRGGMGVVYRAEDPNIGRQVAIKTVTEGLASDARVLQRIKDEARQVGNLRHDNIIVIYEVGQHEGYPYIVMEYVEGNSLERMIAGDETVSLYQKLRIVEQICQALAYSHRQGIIHRDVKPANVIVRPDGVAKLLDFGIARQEKPEIDRNLTGFGNVIGTVPYMAPERLKGAAFNGRSDIFAIGILLYQFLTGQLPFTGADYILVNQLLNDTHPPLSKHLDNYPAALDPILDRALAKSPADRYQFADDMASDLEAIIESLEQGFCEELLSKAEALAASGDDQRALDTLDQVLKIDRRNAHGRALKEQLEARVKRKARAAEAAERRRAAQEALDAKDFEAAIRLLEEAVALVPGDPAVTTELEDARARKKTNDRILEFLQQATNARKTGDYTGAKAILERAIQLDTRNSHLRLAYQSLVRQAEDAAHQQSLKSALNAARDAFRQRDYPLTLELLEKVDLIEPGNLEAADLGTATRAALAEEQRRHLLASIEEQLSGVASEQDARRVAAVIQKALETAPNDAVLLRFQSQIDSVLRDHEIRRMVDDTIRHCSALLETAPAQALDHVRERLAEIPGEPRLLALEARIQTRIEQDSADKARAAILTEANLALKQRAFARAVAILEQCKPPILTPEISQLLDFARKEAAAALHQERLATAFTEATSLLRDQRYDEVAALLAPIQSDAGASDPRLARLLDQARAALEQRKTEQAAALHRIQPFADAGCHEQVLALIEALPASAAASTEIQQLLAACRAAWRLECEHLEELGHAYAALASGDCELPQLDAKIPDPTPILGQIRKSLFARRASTIDSILSAHLERIQAAATAGQPVDPTPVLTENQRLVPFASEVIRSQWTQLVAQQDAAKRSKRSFAPNWKR